MKLALVSLNESADPPLGLAYISSYIKKYSPYRDIVIIDRENIIRRIKQEKPDLIGFSAITPHFFKANELAKEVKKFSNTPTIIGGVHISMMPIHLKKSSFDIAIIGEGEQTMLELLDLYTKEKKFTNKNLKKIKGLCFKDKDKLIFTKPRELIKPLDKIPFPDRDALKMKEIYLLPRMVGSEGNIGIGGTIITSRGCPYDCAFCAPKNFWQITRFFSAEYVIEEIELLINKYKINKISILDDLFIVNKKRVKDIADLLEKKGLNKKISFTLQGRSNLIDEEMISYLKKMNVTHIGFGFESASPKILKYLKKDSVTIEDHKKAIKLCREAGFIIGGSFIIGSPDETKEDIQKTMDFIKEQDLIGFAAYQLTPFPGTEIWEYAKKHGFVTDSFDFNEDLNKLYFENFNPNMLLSNKISKEDFKEFHFKFQEMIRQKRHDNLKFEIKQIKYLFNWRFLLKLIQRRKRVLAYLFPKYKLEQ